MNWIAFVLVLTGVPVLWGAGPMTIGLTGSGAAIEGSSVSGSSSDVPTVLLIGGLEGDGASSRIVGDEVRRFESIPAAHRRFRLLAIPLANPQKARVMFPPQGVAYRDNPEAHYLWRWIGTHAPDLVLVAGEDFGLAEALTGNAAAGMGRIPARRVEARAGLLSEVRDVGMSEAHQELKRRVARSPRQVAEGLAPYYGHELPEAVYIPAVALIGRIRLGQISDVKRIVAPYVDGTRDSLAKATGSHLAGHLVFAELAERTGEARYLDRVRAAADLAFTPSGEMREAMPLHMEMSDAVFMGCPILAKAGKLTGDRKYFDMTWRHLQFMQKLCLRPDGIYRHSPLDAAAWGRGNAFPALGVALALSDFPANHPAFPEMRLAFQKHMQALAGFQDDNGMWREVIDVRGAYPELSATAMIGTAMARGIQRGWLDAGSYQPRVERAWRAVAERVAVDGKLIDVCEGTGKQTSLEAYLHRAAILDRDPRGGAMALLFSTELAGLR
jgi:rhamnogalacturonyl hydrolase YesR